STTSVAVNLSTFCTSSSILFPALDNTSDSGQVVPGATWGTTQSISGGYQRSAFARLPSGGARAAAAGFSTNACSTCRGSDSLAFSTAGGGVGGTGNGSDLLPALAASFSIWSSFFCISLASCPPGY